MAEPDKLNSLLDLKNLDLAQISRIIGEHLNTFIKIVLITGALLIAGLMFNDYRTKDQVLHTRITQAQQKLDAIRARDEAVYGLDNFKSSLPKKLNEFELITVISKYAQLYHISIPSLSPAESKDMGLYDVINVTFNAASDNFKNMMLFLDKIEKSDFPLRVDSWFGSKTQEGYINFQIAISAVLIHQ